MLAPSVLILASTASAFSLPDVSSVLPLFARGTPELEARAKVAVCPPVWNTISTELTKTFLSDGQCNKFARAAIRLVFHDCGAYKQSLGVTGGCDGSLLLNATELGRPENKGLEEIAGIISGMAKTYQVGVADMVVFAGNHATVTCPGGPTVKTYVGRTDSSIAAPDNLLPDVNAPAQNLYQLFQEKGFSATDLAALLGAHSTSNQFHVNEADGIVGQSQDSTPGIWDVKYYSETIKPPPGVFVFPSDAKLANHSVVGKEFSGFVNNQGKWTGKYADAMGRMALFGTGGNLAGLTDCTGALPRSTSVKREMRALPPFAPRH